MLISVLILCLKAAQVCVNPTAEECGAKSTKDTCNAGGTGCRYIDGFAGSCGPQTADSCAVKAQGSCIKGCSWSGDPACVRTTTPTCSKTADDGCSAGCVSGPQTVRCISDEQAETERCAKLSTSSCESDSDCKVVGESCARKTESDYEAESCLELGVENDGEDCQSEIYCEGGQSCDFDGCTCSGTEKIAPSGCKVVSGSCVPKTEDEFKTAFCTWQNTNGEGGCAGDMSCKLVGGNCVPRTTLEFYDVICDLYFSGEIDWCVSESDGMCKVVGNKCQADPEHDFDETDENIPVCSLNSDGDKCDEDKSKACILVYDNSCVLRSCDAVGGSCSADSSAAGCTWVTEGHCEVNSTLVTCGLSTPCTDELVEAGCASAPAVADECQPKAELTCSGSGACGSNALNAGCKTVGEPDKPENDGSSTIAVPMIIFILLALFW